MLFTNSKVKNLYVSQKRDFISYPGVIEYVDSDYTAVNNI